MLVIDVFDDTAFFQFCKTETARQRAILLPEPLLIDQHGKAFLETELAHVGGFQLRAKGIGHAVQLHRVQFFNRRLIQHSDFLSWVRRTGLRWPDRSSRPRGGFHASGSAVPVRWRLGFADREIASAWSEGSYRSRPAVRWRADWPLPSAGSNTS